MMATRMFLLSTSVVPTDYGSNACRFGVGSAVKAPAFSCPRAVTRTLKDSRPVPCLLGRACFISRDAIFYLSAALRNGTRRADGDVFTIESEPTTHEVDSRAGANAAAMGQTYICRASSKTQPSSH